MVALQGDIFWVDAPLPVGSGPGKRRPHVVVQSDSFNLSNIRTVVVCGITSNTDLAPAPGNVLLYKGEGNLPRASVVNVSQVSTFDRSQLGAKIGTLSRPRIREIIAGLHELLAPAEV